MKCLVSLLTALACLPASAAPLTMKKTAQIAYDAGFRGGGVVTAVAVAEAESGLEPLAVSNNYALQDSQGNPLLGSNGRQRIEGVPGVGASAIVPITTPPPPAVALPSLGAYGVIRHHCLGLWQLNDGHDFHGRSVIEGGGDLLDPAINARRLFFRVTECGRHWWRFISVMRGTAWQGDRLSRARAAARLVDPSVLPENALEQQVRVVANYGNVRREPAGEVLRRTRIGDTGRVIEGPVMTQIIDGAHRSYQPCYLIRWDYGVDGWVPEYLIGLVTQDFQPQPASSPSPAMAQRNVPYQAVRLDWCRGGNAVTQIVRLSDRAADLDLPSSIRSTQGTQTGYTFTNKLAHATEYFWRVDTVDAAGRTTRGPVWTFRTEPFKVWFSNFTVSHRAWPASRRVTMSVRVHCTAEQRIVVGASFARSINDPERESAITTTNDPDGLLYTREFQLPPGANPWGDHHFTLSAWLDWDNNGKVTKTDQQVSLYRKGSSTYGYWEMSQEPVRLMDGTPPVITGFTATPSVLNTEAMVPLALRAHITDGNGTGVRVVRASYRRNGGAQVLLPPLTWSVTGEVWQTTVNMPPITGDYQLSLHAMDAHENFGTASTNLRISDLSPPRLTVNSPLNGRSVALGSSISGSAEDPSGLSSIEYQMDGGGWNSLPALGSWDIPAPAVAGPHTMQLRATDTAGNLSPVLTHYFYVIGDPTDPDTFDEKLPLDDGQVPQHWFDYFDTAPLAGLNNGRLEASGTPHVAKLYRDKLVPEWVDTVELSFRLTGYGGVRWRKIIGSKNLQVSVVPPTSPTTSAGVFVIESGQGQQAANDAPAFITPCRVLIRNGSIECRFINDQGAPSVLMVNDPTLSLDELNRMTWEAEGYGNSTSALDDLQIRGLRFENRFQILSNVHTGSHWRITCTTAPGRLYRLFRTADLRGPWIQSSEARAHGLIMDFTDFVTMPQPEKNFWRVEELD